MCRASPTRQRSASLSASRPVPGSFILRTPLASYRDSTRITSPRCLMTSASRIVFIAGAAACSVLLAGCQLKQDMAHQPKARPLATSEFFTDGRSERPLIENTGARGLLAGDETPVPQDS